MDSSDKYIVLAQLWELKWEAIVYLFYAIA